MIEAERTEQHHLYDAQTHIDLVAKTISEDTAVTFDCKISQRAGSVSVES